MPDSDLSAEHASPNSSQNLYRAVCGAGALAVLMSREADWQQPSDLTLASIGFVLSYLLVTSIAARLSRKTPERGGLIGNWIGNIDALLIGAFLAWLEFPLLTALVFTTLIQSNALSTGGVSKWTKDNLSFVLGIATVVALNQPDWNIRINQPVHVVTLAVFAFYFSFYGYQQFTQIRRLRNEVSTLREKQMSLKLNNYSLSKYLSPSLRDAIASGKEVKLETQRKRLAVFFSDIVGFSAIADEMDSDSLTAVINEYLTEMSKIAIEYGGTIDKFIGDAVMVFFGDPQTRGPKEDCIACVSMALAMKKKATELQAGWRNQGILKPLQIRIGISVGFCTVGNFGTESRLDYTLLGKEVNLASRLETSAAPGEILISHSTYLMVKDIIICEDRGEIKVKGFREPIQIYRVKDFRKNLADDRGHLDFTTEGFSLFMDVDKIYNYEEKKVLSALHGAFRQIQQQIEKHTNGKG
ncbi:MAG: adenylate/guanylate cyclase domain-containing protein [Porticoccaceae bacterium]